MERKKLLPIAALFAIFVAAIAAPFGSSVLCAATDVQLTVTKDTIACANATVAVYEIESKYWGLYQKVGAFAGSATTNSEGVATISGLDSAKTYLAKITYAGKVYEQKFAPAAEVAVKLTETSWIKGNIVPLLLGGAVVFVLLYIIGQVNPRVVRFGR